MRRSWGEGNIVNVPGKTDTWYMKTVDGATINVRSKSTTALPDGSKPRWTLEIKDQKLNQLIQDKGSGSTRREIKFK